MCSKTPRDAFDQWRQQRSARVELTEADYLILAAIYRRSAARREGRPGQDEEVLAAREVLMRIAKELAA